MLQQAVVMQQDLADVLLAATSEAEARNYLAKLPGTRDLLISASLHVPESDKTYARVWRGKGALTRVLQERGAALISAAAADDSTRQALERWRDTRRQLARSMLATADARDHAELIQRPHAQLTADKERPERLLAAAIPGFARQKVFEQSPYTMLLQSPP